MKRKHVWNALTASQVLALRRGKFPILRDDLASLRIPGEKPGACSEIPWLLAFVPIERILSP